MARDRTGDGAPARLHFGPFVLDETRWQLQGPAGLLPLAPRLVAMLAFLARRPGQIVTREDLLAAFWTDVVVTDNSVARAISDLRSALGDDPLAPRYLQTVARRGYRFIAAVSASGVGDDPGPARAGPVIDGVRARPADDGNAALDLAIADLEHRVRETPDDATAHAALAEAREDRHARNGALGRATGDDLLRALAAARRACDLAPWRADGWRALACVLARLGRTDSADEAHELAAALDPDNARHWARYAAATWGRRCLAAFGRARALGELSVDACVRAAMVHIARGDTAAAWRAVAEPRRPDASASSAAIDYLEGLLHLGDNDSAAALSAWERAVGRGGHSVPGAPAAVRSQTAIGLWALDSARPHAALVHFVEALSMAPGEAAAMLGLQWTLVDLQAAAEATRLAGLVAGRIEALDRAGAAGDALLLRGAALARAGWPDRAVDAVRRALAAEPHGPLGWSLRVDPLFRPLRAATGFASLAASVAERAR